MRVVFLDIDGVLNPDAWAERRCIEAPDDSDGTTFDPTTVQVINEITARSGARIVVSSAWRHYFNVSRLRRILAENGVVAEVIGTTPTLGEGRYEDRGNEIRAWLARHPEVSAAVIIDDVNAMGPSADLLVQTNPEVGLCWYQIPHALEILGCGCDA
jgi:hypothetical protein